MPAAAVNIGIKQLEENAKKMLDENRLPRGRIKTMGTPRRLILLIKQLAKQQDDLAQEVKGPAKKAAYDDDGQPTTAAVGFARGQGVDVDQLVIKEIPQGEYVFALVKEEGQPATQVLEKTLPELVSAMSFPKMMRWDSAELQFVRPIRWMLALLGDKTIEFKLHNLKSGNLTWGHRYLATNPIQVGQSSDYLDAMRIGKIMVDHVERAAYIKENAQRAAREVGGKAVIHQETFAEVVQLVENPHVIVGSFSEEFIGLPRDVLMTSMESHQRYLPVEDDKGALLPFFIVVHNGDQTHADLIRRGHERVIRARLADANFFFEEDQKQPLDQKVQKLQKVVFQEKLGTVFEKTQRVEELVAVIGTQLSVADDVMENAKRAAYLSKADLVTEMVVEFPALQGVMGREYALLSGEKRAVADAIYQHYLPRSAGDDLPEGLEGKVLSIADKIDSIVGCFAIGLLPTGSEDPYALRRQAQGLINISLDGKLDHLMVTDMLEHSLRLFKEADLDLRPNQEIRDDLQTFFKSRLRGHFLNQGFDYDVIDAVLVLEISSPTSIRQRIEVITKMRDTSQMDDVITAFSRCKNLARPELGTEVDESLFEQPEEIALFDSISKVDARVEEDLSRVEYAQVIEQLASIRPVVDKFFDEVLVMAEQPELRDNRLRLLNRCVEPFFKMADFSMLVVPGQEQGQ